MTERKGYGMKKAKYQIVLLCLLWIVMLAKTVVIICSNQNILGIIPWLLYALALTVMYAVRRRATISEETRDLLIFGFELGALLPIVDFIASIIEYLWK